MLTPLWICQKEFSPSLQCFLFSLFQVLLHYFFCIFKIQAAIRACPPTHPTLQKDKRKGVAEIKNEREKQEVNYRSETEESGDFQWSFPTHLCYTERGPGWFQSSAASLLCPDQATLKALKLPWEPWEPQDPREQHEPRPQIQTGFIATIPHSIVSPSPQNGLWSA